MQRRIPFDTWQRTAAAVRRFLAIEAASGVVLLAATLTAFVLANSSGSGSLRALWATPAGSHPLDFWVDDGLMTIFFLVVGLEIRRELHDGALSDLRRALLPAAAALGGMLAPAAIYAACNTGRAGVAGWGIPMATDIAFAVGALTLLGRRVPPSLRVMLLALAVIDDIGAIVVIAIFYSGGFDVIGLALAASGVAGVCLLRAAEVRRPYVYVGPGLVVWVGLLRAGIHPTLAGVVLGLMTPPESSVALVRVLHPWVAYAIMPLFALANAGVDIGGARLEGDAGFVFVGIVGGLLVGKPIGVYAAARLAARRSEVTSAALAVLGTVAGVGFTMSLFIAQLAFPEGPLLATAKLAILVGSSSAVLATVLVGLLAARRR